MSRSMPRARQMVGKYRLEKVIGEGGFSVVFRARDTIEEILVALKVFRSELSTSTALELFRQEARVTARLEHANILGIKDANVVDGRLVIASRLGKETLAERMTRRLSVRTAVFLARQILAALAHAHEQRVVHLDVKPENFILFDGDTLRLTDFGIARFAMRTLQGSGSGTVGYVSPEQAMGRPSYRSDVFSAGLLLWRLFSGRLPEWPFEAPLPGMDRLRRNLPKAFIDFLSRSIAVRPNQRFRDCAAMAAAFERVAAAALQSSNGRGRRKRRVVESAPDWRTVRIKQFLREYRAQLGTKHECPTCAGPVAESMLHCPWCARELKALRGSATTKRCCTRCRRSMKGDWRFCAWCYGKAQEPTSSRELADKRYSARCANSSCSRRQLMPFMKYCPWCRTKVRRKWKIEGTGQKCSSCGWGILRDFWKVCPWCGKGAHS